MQKQQYSNMFKLNATVGNNISSSNINNVQIEMQLLDNNIPSNITAYVAILTFVQNNSTEECKLNATV